MSSPISDKVTPVPGLQAEKKPPARSSILWKAFLVLVLVAMIAVAVWQLWQKQQPGMVAGRPLSSLQTHLHTVVMSNRPGVVYLGTHFGLFTSTDGGQTWPQNQGALNTRMITSVAVSPNNPNLLAVLAVPTGGVGSRWGIYVSSDAGKSWHFTVPAGLPASAYPYSIQAGAGAQGHFYAFFSYAGWFETQDLGQHWYAITSGRLAAILVPSLLTDPANPDHLIMGGDQGLFTTWNDGRTWLQLLAVQGDVVALAASSSASKTSQTVYCATDQGLYRWQDGQQPAVTRLSNLPASTEPLRLVAATSARGPVLYALFGSDLWFSADLGATWAHRWHFTRSDMVSLVLDPADPSELLAGFFSPGLVLISHDAGRTWQTLTD